MSVQELLLGRKIVGVRYMTANEVNSMGWRNPAIVLTLDNGISIYPSVDAEGNDSAVMFTTSEEFPVV